MQSSDILKELKDKVSDFKESRYEKLFLTARFDHFDFTKELLDYCKLENVSIEHDLGFCYEFSIRRRKNSYGDWVYQTQKPFNFEINLKTISL